MRISDWSSDVCSSDLALRHLEPKEPAQGTAPSQDCFLYSGNRHESVPRALFLDRRLTPLERNAWQVFRLQLNDDGVTAFPTYDQLRPYLASMPCARSEEHTSELQSLMRNSNAVFCLKKKTTTSPK